MLVTSVTGPEGSLNPERYLVYELLQMEAPLSWSNPRLIALASMLPESQVASVVTAYRSAISSCPLYGPSLEVLSLLLTTILQDETSLLILQCLEDSGMPGSLTTLPVLLTGRTRGI